MRRTREEVALDILKNPERFASLPKRTDFERQLCLWRAPSFSTHSSWSIFLSRGATEFIARRLEHEPRHGLPANAEDPHIYGAETMLHPDVAAKTIAAFESLVLPIFRRPQFLGVDGTSYGIIFGNHWQGTSVNWWGETPLDWSPLVILFDQTVEQLDGLLPASTLRTTGP
jgi:hypothetical protein